ncbi:MAG TPA: transporter substrate-binding domain-containing protein [Stellaceae bacterium]|jgi:polar amino acid transport system substrate-binding protein|nr:transporter substrate-binding domain-containing protein [Stellaceae bacterium]
MSPVQIAKEVINQLAPSGTLDAGINLSNPLLVTGRGPAGEPTGVSPDMAAAIAERLGVPVRYRTYERAGDTADAVGECGIVLVGSEPQRAQTIAFSPAYVEIESTYLVPAGSPLKAIADIDRPGVRIAVAARAAYDLWLERNIRHATLVRVDGLDAAFAQFKAEKLEALAGLRPALLPQAALLPGSRILDGQFTAVLQAIGTAKANTAAAAFISDFVEEAKASGLVARLIAKHSVNGLTVAQPAA